MYTLGLKLLLVHCQTLTIHASVVNVSVSRFLTIAKRSILPISTSGHSPPINQNRYHLNKIQACESRPNNAGRHKWAGGRDAPSAAQPQNREMSCSSHVVGRASLAPL